MTVADLMCESPVTIRSDASTDDALDLFYEYETAELYVVDDSGCLLGVLPDYELLKAELSGEARVAQVEQLMSRSIPTVTPDSDAAEVARLFRVSYCSRIPVLKAGRLIGVVTRADVLRLMAVFRRLERESKKTQSLPKRPKILKSFAAKPDRPERSRTTGASKMMLARRPGTPRRAT